MTMMMGDSRACAMAVNELLTPREKKGPKLTERQVEEHSRCFLFGHYDSRGGATLVRAKNLIEAFQKYAEAFGWSVKNGQLEDEGMRQHFEKHPKAGESYEEWKPDALHGLMEEDFMFSCNVIVCDEPLGGESELDRKYCDDPSEGYSYGVLQYRWRHKDWSKHGGKANEELSKWSSVSAGCRKTLVFWKGPGKKRPQIDPKALQMSHLPGLEVRIVKKSYGEDACGVCWIP